MGTSKYQFLPIPFTLLCTNKQVQDNMCELPSSQDDMLYIHDIVMFISVVNLNAFKRKTNVLAMKTFTNITFFAVTYTQI